MKELHQCQNEKRINHLHKNDLQQQLEFNPITNMFHTEEYSSFTLKGNFKTPLKFAEWDQTEESGKAWAKTEHMQ